MRSNTKVMVVHKQRVAQWQVIIDCDFCVTSHHNIVANSIQFFHSCRYPGWQLTAIHGLIPWLVLSHLKTLQLVHAIIHRRQYQFWHILTAGRSFPNDQPRPWRCYGFCIRSSEAGMAPGDETTVIVELTELCHLDYGCWSIPKGSSAG